MHVLYYSGITGICSTLQQSPGKAKRFPCHHQLFNYAYEIGMVPLIYLLHAAGAVLLPFLVACAVNLRTVSYSCAVNCWASWRHAAAGDLPAIHLIHFGDCAVNGDRNKLVN